MIQKPKVGEKSVMHTFMQIRIRTLTEHVEKSLSIQSQPRERNRDNSYGRDNRNRSSYRGDNRRDYRGRTNQNGLTTD